MRTNPDTSADTLPTLGPAIKPAKPAEPDPVGEFHGKPHELIGNTDAAVQTIVDTLRKKASELPEYGMPIVHIDDDDCAGFTEHTLALLSAI